MSRKMKNTIMIFAIILVCVLSYFTINHAVKNSMPSNQFGQGEREIPQNFNNKETQEGDIPEKPSEDFSDRNQEEKPSMPDRQSENAVDANELPEENSRRRNGEELSRGDIDKNVKIGMKSIYYILFAIEALIVSVGISYLIMSHLNSKTLKETLQDSKKIIIFLLLTVMITVGLTVLQVMLTQNTLQQNQPRQTESVSMPRDNKNVSNSTDEETTTSNESETTNQSNTNETNTSANI